MQACSFIFLHNCIYYLVYIIRHYGNAQYHKISINKLKLIVRSLHKLFARLTAFSDSALSNEFLASFELQSYLGTVCNLFCLIKLCILFSYEIMKQ